MADAAQIAAQSLHGASRSGAGWIACCPAHDDNNPSLSLRDGEGGALLVHCFAGCEAKAVLTALRHKGAGHAVNPRTDTPPAPRERDVPEYVRRLWQSSLPAEETMVQTYLASRGIKISCLSVWRF